MTSAGAVSYTHLDVYKRQDLMEAKRQILGVGENMGTEESKKIWEENAQFWDNAMGDESNEFHREVVLSLIHISGLDFIS